MKLRHKKENGFTLLMVILTLGLVAIQLALLTAGSKTIMFQADDAYLHACQDNLKASAIAWAEMNTQQETAGKEIQLDITEMNIPRSELRVKISTPQNQKAQLDVNASCSKARNTLRRKYTYKIDELN
ncbi:MAG: hypothetical protein ACYTE8_08150 [Planctomycetota bacterium]|jgi:Tfp pilus assembly protein PilV